jgi:hypothetical protein
VKRLHAELLVSLIFGLAAGLTYSWVVAPASNASTNPSSLRPDIKDQFRSSIASAYSATGDLGRARARLELLGDTDTVQALTAQAQRTLAAGQSFEHAQELARLASDLQAGVSSIPSVIPARSVEAASNTPALSATPDLTSTTTPLVASPRAELASPTLVSNIPSPPPSQTAIPSPSAPFQLASRNDTCDPALPEGLLQVTVLDGRGVPLPGIEIGIAWDQGQERFFTGLQPEVSNGYADYSMQAETSYSVQVARLGLPVSGLVAPVCSGTGGRSYIGGLQLTFKAP